jgi:hypothetical protein
MSGEGNERVIKRDAIGEPSSRTDAQPPRNGGTAPSTDLVILVDASNVAHGKTSFATQPRIENLKRLLDRLRGYHVRIVALADASLRYKIDQSSELESMMASGLLEQVPAGTAADDFLWQLWKSYTSQGSRAYIVTNDKFPSTNAAAESRTESPRIAFMFVGTELIFQPPIESLLPTGRSSPEAMQAAESSSSGDAPTHPDASPESQSNLSFGDIDGTPPPGVTYDAEVAGEEVPDKTRLVEGAIEAIAALTQPPGGVIRRVNFATVAHDLHQRFQGDFVSKFGLRRPKDLAEELALRGLVTISYTNTTMYVEPTLAFEGRIIGRKFPRRQVGQSDSSEGETNVQAVASSVVKEQGKTEQTLPEVIEVSSRDLGPTVEIPGLELFLKLVQDSHPKHVFHWWSQRRGDSGSLWQLEGEFFFVSEGTTYKLAGHGYRTLGDFVDGRARGMKDALDPKAIGGPEHDAYYEPSSPQRWKAIVESRNLDYHDYRPSEGDVYYYVREKGFSDFAAFLAAERAKPKPSVYYA